MEISPTENTTPPNENDVMKVDIDLTNMEPEGNIVTLTDSYKLTHYPQYPEGTEYVYSYFESRGGEWKEICFYGLQMIIMKYLVGQVVTKKKIDEAENLTKKHMFGAVFNRAGWEYILDAYNGHLPLSIRAVPEGTVVPTKNVLLTVVNTDPKCYWLTNYVETLLVQVWYPMTVCTSSREQKKIILGFLKETGDVNLVDFKLHDFGFRGVSSVETAGIGGSAHLVNFKGTDTLEAVVYAGKYYGAECAGFSIPASEHSTITSWGKDKEDCAMRNMLETYPTGLVACVSDSYNIFEACENIWGKELKELVFNRDGTLVVRPDSGDPLTVVPKIHEILGKAFGVTINKQGYKVLDKHVRVIQGDGVNIKSLREILQVLKNAGWSADNIAFGSGGALLQKLDRDTLKCAFKCSEIIVNGKAREVFKEPITDPGKNSKKGRLSLVPAGEGLYKTIEGDEDAPGNVLVEIYRDGKLLRPHSFDEIRERAEITLP